MGLKTLKKSNGKVFKDVYLIIFYLKPKGKLGDKIN